MRKKKQNNTEMKLIIPDSSADIENVVEMLQTKEMSVLINMSQYKKLKPFVINKIIRFIETSQKSYMTIKVKKIYPKVLVCWSKHPELYV